MIRFVNFRASDIEPNPDEVMYWVDLNEDPRGGMIKYWDVFLGCWRTIRVLEGTLAEIEQRIYDWVEKHLQDQEDKFKEDIDRIDGEIAIIQDDVKELFDTKQDNLTAGFGIVISDDNVISCTVDLSLYRVVSELPTEDIDNTKIYIVVDPGGQGQNTHKEYVYLDGQWELLGEYADYASRDEFLEAVDELKATDEQLQKNIDAEEAARIEADNTLQSNIDTTNTKLQSEIDRSTAKDTEHDSAISDLQTTDEQLQSNIDAEAAKRQQQDEVLTSLIQAETEARTEADNEIINVLSSMPSTIVTELGSPNTTSTMVIFDDAKGVTKDADNVYGVEQPINTVSIPQATTTTAGVLSASDKKILNNLNTLDEVSHIDHNTFTIDSDSVTMNYQCIKTDGETTQISKDENQAVIPAATSNTAGVMTAADKTNLDVTIPNSIQTEVNRATQAENTITQNLNQEITNRINEISRIESLVSSSTTDLSEQLQDEIDRATQAENTISSNLAPIKTAWDSKNASNGLIQADSTGKIPSSVLPSYVDDVLEYDSLSAFPDTGESGKIYIAKDTNLTYRWSGSTYTEISQSLALGETSSTAYAGDKGKANRDALNTLPSKIVNTFPNFTATAGNVTVSGGTYVSKFGLNYGSDAAIATRTIPAVTTTTAGVMLPADKVKLNNIAENANNYVLPVATNTTLGGVKLGYTTTDKNYAVQIDSNNNLYVNVPWTDTTGPESTTYTFTSGTDGSFTVTPSNGTAQKVSIGKPATAGTADTASVSNTSRFLITLSGDYDPIAGASGLQYIWCVDASSDYVGTATDKVQIPNSRQYHILRMNHGNSNGYYSELAVPLSYTTGDMYWRVVASMNTNTSSRWYKIYDDHNLQKELDSQWIDIPTHIYQNEVLSHYWSRIAKIDIDNITSNNSYFIDIRQAGDVNYPYAFSSKLIINKYTNGTNSSLSVVLNTNQSHNEVNQLTKNGLYAVVDQDGGIWVKCYADWHNTFQYRVTNNNTNSLDIIFYSGDDIETYIGDIVPNTVDIDDVQCKPIWCNGQIKMRNDKKYVQGSVYLNNTPQVFNSNQAYLQSPGQQYIIASSGNAYKLIELTSQLSSQHNSKVYYGGIRGFSNMTTTRFWINPYQITNDVEWYADTNTGLVISNTDTPKWNGNHLTLQQYLTDSTNLNNLTKFAGFGTNQISAYATQENNYPYGGAGGLIYVQGPYNRSMQIYGTFDQNRWFVRGGGNIDTEYTAWKELVTVPSTFNGLNTVGSTTTPVYINKGIATACTSVQASKTTGTLTFTGTVTGTFNGSSDLTINIPTSGGVADSVTWANVTNKPISGSTNITTVSGTTSHITTEQFLEKVQSMVGSNQYGVWRGSWNYSNNDIIDDVPGGALQLAGCVIEYFGKDNVHQTIRVTTPTTSTLGGNQIRRVLVYINNGDTYNPGWYALARVDELEALQNSLAAVATSGSYNDLTNKPTIPVDLTSRVVALETALQQLQDTLNAHIANKFNPHEVTADQLNLGTTDNVRFAKVNATGGFFKE